MQPVKKNNTNSFMSSDKNMALFQLINFKTSADVFIRWISSISQIRCQKTSLKKQATYLKGG